MSITTRRPDAATRTELIYLLSRAAELEHSLMCQYLFTAFTLKGAGDDGVTPRQGRMLLRWSDTLTHIAIQEMRHLAQVCNLLTAIGGAPVLRRPPFPQYATYFSLGIESTLTAFSPQTIHRYMCWEKPASVEAPGCGTELDRSRLEQAARTHVDHLTAIEGLVPEEERRYHSIGELYEIIDRGIASMPARELFIGPPAAQMTNDLIPFREPLTVVTSHESAHRAIHLIVVEGEGTPSHKPHSDRSHFARFKEIYQELHLELERDPRFAPAWPTVDNPVYVFAKDIGSVAPGAHIITNAQARRVGALFLATYDLALHLLLRFFAHTDENPNQLRTLIDAATSLMSGAIRPLGITLTHLPAGEPHEPAYQGLFAGPSFETYGSVELLPHMASAWTSFHERALGIAADCQALSCEQDASPRLADVADVMQFWARQLERAVS